MTYASWSVVYGEQPSAAKWNILGSNDAAFNDGSGLPLANSNSASVDTSETRSSASYGDLATVGPSVTVTIGASGKAIVIITSELTNDTTSEPCRVSFVASGANSISASNTRALTGRNTTGAPQLQASWMYLATGLTPGSTTFKLQYSSSAGGTATFSNRKIAIITL